VPSFRKPTINIGERQKGRLQSNSVVNCEVDRVAIGAAIAEAMALDCSQTQNPYGGGDSSRRIVEQLKAVSEPRALLKKHFFDWNTVS
jgi:UDP-N-acetylglucosamine 2-epimerase (non-hydrolysing)/GDP/UDP-N,N'-diacetylbacillosamine 2-epimerase (hydrolysing)